MGDWVIADDPTTPGEIEARQVLDTFVHNTNKLVDVYIDGEVISTTEEHPFWTPDKGWVEAKDLQVGSLLQTEDGMVIDVDNVERREGSFIVYNFKVEDIPTYFVSELHILVHNIDCTGRALELQNRMGGGEILRVKPSGGMVLPEPPRGYGRSGPWHYHDVFVKNGMVYDPMGWGNAPVPFDEWINYYGRNFVTISLAPI